MLTLIVERDRQGVEAFLYRKKHNNNKHVTRYIILIFFWYSMKQNGNSDPGDSAVSFANLLINGYKTSGSDSCIVKSKLSSHFTMPPSSSSFSDGWLHG